MLTTAPRPEKVRCLAQVPQVGRCWVQDEAQTPGLQGPCLRHSAVPRQPQTQRKWCDTRADIALRRQKAMSAVSLGGR